MYIPEEDDIQLLCVEFIQFAYNEMQTEHWYNRRNNIRNQYNIIYDNISSESEHTFSEILEKNNGDLNITLYGFFCNEIMSRGWFTAFCYKAHPELIQIQFIDDLYDCWHIDNLLCKWLWLGKTDNEYIDELKCILGLDFCMK